MFNIGVRSLKASQSALDTTAQNVANAETPEYVRREVVMETATSVTTSIGQVGTGVQVREIQRKVDQLLTDQVIDFQSQQSRDEALRNILTEAEVLFPPNNASGVGADLSNFFSSVQDLANNPTGSTERTVMQTAVRRLADTFHLTSGTLTDLRRGIDNEVKSTMARLNSMTAEIARLNKQIVEENTTLKDSGLLDRRDQVVRELSDLIGIRTIDQANGSVTVLLGKGRSIVDQDLAVTFVTEANGGNSGLVDVRVKDFGGATQTVTSEITAGRLGGLLSARDTKISGYLTKLDTLASTFIQQVNLKHTQGVGAEAATSLTTDYAVSNVAEELGTTDAGLVYQSLVKDGSFDVILYDSAGAVTSQTTIAIDKDPGGTTLTSLASALNGISGITASANGTTGKMTVTADGSNRLAFRNDTSQVLAAIGLNTLLKGSSANDIALGTEVAANSKLIATGKVAAGTGVFAAGDNANALDIGDLENARLLSSNTQTFHEAQAAIVGAVGSDVADAKSGLERSEILLNRLEERRADVSGVSRDEELANLIRYQQSYAAAARLITVAQGLMDTLQSLLG